MKMSSIVCWKVASKFIKPKEHYQGLVEPVTFLDVNIVESPSYIKLAEVLGVFDLVYDI